MATKKFPDPSLPVAEWMLQGFTYGERTRIRAARKAWLAANKDKLDADKAALQRTCQICSRPIFAETGKIAHHGYLRPYQGYQTSSCFGARALPFERSRDTLGLWIEIVTGWRDAAIEHAAKVRRGETPLPITWTDSIRIPGGRRQNIEQTFWADTPEAYSWAQAVKFAFYYGNTYYRFDESKVLTWEQARELHAKDIDASVGSHEAERESQQRRYDNWVQLEAEVDEDGL